MLEHNYDFRNKMHALKTREIICHDLTISFFFCKMKMMRGHEDEETNNIQIRYVIRCYPCDRCRQHQTSGCHILTQWERQLGSIQ